MQAKVVLRTQSEGHFHYVGLHVVGHDNAVETPLGTQYVGAKCLATARPAIADTVETAHDAKSVTALDVHLKRLQVNLAQGLFVCPHLYAAAFRFLIVKHKVFCIGVHAVLHRTFGGLCAHYTGDKRIFAVILEVTSAHCRAVNIDTRRIPTRTAYRCAFLADAFAKQQCAVGVPSGGNHHFRAVPRTLQREHRRSVVVIGQLLADTLDFHRLEVAVVDKVCHVA